MGKVFDLCAHVLLVETDSDGLILVDTGVGSDDCASPLRRLGPLFMGLVGRRLRLEQTALQQVRRLGFAASDVRHIIPTHLDLDHAGGLPDFPHAKVHVMEAEQRAVLARKTWMERERYRVGHFAHGPKWESYEASGGSWRGFSAVRQLRGLPPEILLIPLDGHTRGHACVAIETKNGPLVHCGDAYFDRHTVDAARRPGPWELRVFEQVVAMDRSKVAQNHRRLRELNSESDVALFCAHDFEELRARPATVNC